VDYPDITQMTVAIDLTNLRYFFRTYQNSQIQMITMADFLAGNHPDVVQFARVDQEQFNNIADTATALA
jgi:penicillin V acylase-like amidase (Ntn superfamily)